MVGGMVLRDGGSVMSDRDGFEGWYSQEGEYGGLPLDRHDEDGDYVDDFVQSMWMAWQAARAQGGQGAVPVITNAMKAECIGEFSFTVDVPCGECLVEGEDDDCEVCGGELTHEQSITVPWDTCKKIYKRMAAFAPMQNGIPNEQGKNRYGLDMAYFRNLFNRELNRPLVDFRPDELARVLVRAARTADAAVLQEPEFQPAQQGSVPEEWRAAVKRVVDELSIMDESEGIAGWHLNGDVSPWDEGDLPALRDELMALLTTPQPAGDGSIKCSDRLPTEADEDICGQVWGWVETKGVGKWFRMSATETRDMSGNRAGPICTLWMPTGLKRPQPPAQEGEGDER